MKLKYPTPKVLDILATREEQVYRLDPKEALHVLYEALRYTECYMSCTV